MRRTKLIGVAALVAMLMLVGTSPATAAGVAMRASLDVAFTFQLGCASGVVTVEGTGSGTLTLGAFDGDVEAEMSQCTGFLVGGPFDPDAATEVGKVTDGLLTFTAMGDDGSGVLMLAYEGGFVANANGTQGYGHWEVADGSGIFEDASGHGGMHLSGEEALALQVELMGSVVVP